jgi:hypothetical protein
MISLSQIALIVNNLTIIENTKLIGSYLSQDPHLISLILLIKLWTKNKRIINPQASTLTPYCWTLLVIHFLLVYRFNDSGSPFLSCHDENDQISLGELFTQFFIYYGTISQDSQQQDLLKTILTFEPQNDFFIQKKTDEYIHNQSIINQKNIIATTMVPFWRLSVLDPLNPSRDLGSCIDQCEGQALIFNQLNEVVQLFRDFSTQVVSLDNLIDDIFGFNPNPQVMEVNDEQEEEYSGQEIDGARCSGFHLFEHLLHWNIKTLIGPTFLTKMRKIPHRFGSSDQWFDTFFPFILEELRCSLRHILENFDDEPRTFQPMIQINHRGHTNVVIGELSFESLNIDEKNFIEKNMCGGVGLFVSQYEKGDLMETLKTNKHFFVHVDYRLQHSEAIRFKCQFPKNSFLKELAQSRYSGWKFILLDTHLSAVKRVCDALGSRVTPPFMDDILKGKVHQDCEADNKMIGNLNILDGLTLNNSQICVIQNVLQVGLHGHPRIQLIKGPPGIVSSKNMERLSSLT